MSKLGHSNEETMRIIETRRTWDEYGSDAFEMWDAAGVDNAEVEIACGAGVAQEYSSWIYHNLK